MNGINLVLSYTGREYVYRKVYTQLGLNTSSVELGHGGVEAGPAERFDICPQHDVLFLSPRFKLIGNRHLNSNGFICAQ